MVVGEKKNAALVLSGGGIKAAAFHLGVCLALREKGFQFAGGSATEVAQKYSKDQLTFKIYVGSSAGSFVSSLLASGYSIESIIDAFERGVESQIFPFSRRNKSYERIRPISYKDIFSVNGSGFINSVTGLFSRKSLVSGGFEALLKSGFKVNGLFTTKGIEKYLRVHALKTNRFSELGVRNFVVATQLNFARKIVFGHFNENYKIKNTKYSMDATISDAVAASTALPPFFSPYGIKNQKGKDVYFFDGEIRDTLSTHVAADAGADLVISSYSIQPYHYNPVMGSLHNYGIPLIINQALYQVIQQKIDKHIEFQNQISTVLNSIETFFNQNNLNPEDRDRLVDQVAKKIHFRREVDYLYIHPSPNDHEMFFVDHFSLNPTVLAKIVNTGFKSGIQILRKIQFH